MVMVTQNVMGTKFRQGINSNLAFERRPIFQKHTSMKVEVKWGAVINRKASQNAVLQVQVRVVLMRGGERGSKKKGDHIQTKRSDRKNNQFLRGLKNSYVLKVSQKEQSMTKGHLRL